MSLSLSPGGMVYSSTSGIQTVHTNRTRALSQPSLPCITVPCLCSRRALCAVISPASSCSSVSGCGCSVGGPHHHSLTSTYLSGCGRSRSNPTHTSSHWPHCSPWCSPSNPSAPYCPTVRSWPCSGLPSLSYNSFTASPPAVLNSSLHVCLDLFTGHLTALLTAAL